MPGNTNSGRRARSKSIAGVQQSLDATANQATTILDNQVHQRRGFKKLAPSLLQTCYYVIDHAIGKARLKIEHSGGIMTYGELAKSADDKAKASPELLIDVDKIGKN